MFVIDYKCFTCQTFSISLPFQAILLQTIGNLIFHSRGFLRQETTYSHTLGQLNIYYHIKIFT